MNGRQTPWYVETFLAIGGWIAGLLAAGAIFAMAAAIVGDFKDEGSDIVAALIALVVGGGFVFAGVSIGGPGKGDFLRHFAIAAIAAGLTAATAGVWYLLFKPFDGAGAEERVAVGGAGLATAALLAIIGSLIVRRMRDGILTFLTALAVYGVFVAAMWFLFDGSARAWRPDALIAPLCVLGGAFVFVRATPDALARPAGAALMIAPMLHFALLRDIGFLFENASIARVIFYLSEALFAAAALYCLWTLRARYALVALAASAALVLAGVWFLPSAGAVAIVILLAATAANHRGLAVVGIVALAWFIGRFYYDLSMTLLEKSAVMAAMGAATLTGALLFRRFAKGGGAQSVSGARRSALAVLGVAAVLAAALGYVNTGVFRLETAFKDAREIYLPLAPVDPRSLIQGDYMVLNYDNAIYPLFDDIAALADEGEVFLKLDENNVATFSRIAATGDVPRPDEIRIDYVKTGRTGLRYVPESWFFQEGEAEIFQPARFAVVKVAPDGQARLVGLGDENRTRLGE
jgi:uncharacterized membrane-anchored protein